MEWCILIINGVDYTFEDGASATVCVDVDLESCIVFGWTSGSYDYETSFTLMNPSGEIVFEGDADSIPEMMGSCAMGCTDSNYAEFNPDAQVDDGSCATFVGTCNPVTLEVGGGSWDGEISWTLGENSGIAGSYDLCLDDGCYTLQMFDSYGDGWNGASAVLTSAWRSYLRCNY